jgi:hypothetical protein
MISHELSVLVHGFDAMLPTRRPNNGRIGACLPKPEGGETQSLVDGAGSERFLSSTTQLGTRV